MSRRSVSEKIQTDILCKCRRRCALCFGLDSDFSEKKGQIAHIDRDNTNNNEENLVYLCLDHHNLYDSKFKQTKNFTPLEVKTYKKELENYIERQKNENIKYVDEDYKLFLVLKKFFIDSDVLTKFKTFIFSTPYYLEDFEISEGLHGSDLINDYESKYPEVNFKDPYLKEQFNIFKENYYDAESLLSYKYQNYNNDGSRMVYNIHYTHEEKLNHIEEFDNYRINILESFKKIMEYFDEY